MMSTVSTGRSTAAPPCPAARTGSARGGRSPTGCRGSRRSRAGVGDRRDVPLQDDKEVARAARIKAGADALDQRPSRPGESGRHAASRDLPAVKTASTCGCAGRRRPQRSSSRVAVRGVSIAVDVDVAEGPSPSRPGPPQPELGDERRCPSSAGLERRIDPRRVRDARQALALGNVLAAMIGGQRHRIIDAAAVEHARGNRRARGRARSAGGTSPRLRCRRCGRHSRSPTG